MKKNLFWLIFGSLFVISCSGSDDSIPCVTVADCPDSSFVCLDGECILDTAETTDDSDTHDGNGGGSGTSDSDSSNGGGNTSSDDDNGGGLPDPEADDDAKSDSEQGEGGETADSDGAEENDGETTDGNGENSEGENDDDGDSSANEDENPADDSDIDENPVGEVTDCTGDEDCSVNINNKRCNPALHKCVICFEDSHCNPALGENCDLTTHECVSNKTCAAAIAQLPYGGKYDWEDGTTQGFSTNAYWNLVSSSLLPAEVEPVLTHGGNYSFGQYSGYSELMDYTSVLESVSDLSSCSQCVVKAHFYARGQVENDSSSRDFIHPTCNGAGQFEAKNSKVSTQSFDPESPWEKARFDNGQGFEVKYNSYSTQKWTELDWTIPEACKTDQFVFGLRFTSSFMVNKNGLVVDDLTIATAATAHEPNGEFESAANGYIKGWTCDLDASAKTVLVKVEYYKNGQQTAENTKIRWVYADKEIPSSPDSPLVEECGATYNHGFELPLDEELKEFLGEEGTHKLAAFAVDIPSAENLCGGTYTKLGEKEFEVTDLDPK